MGGSGWAYVVDHQPDVAAALEQLRRNVFEAGDYYPRSINPEYAAFMGIRPMESNPASLDELLEMQTSEGTHSILDIDGGLSAGPRPGTASPLTADQMRATFASLTPECEQVTAWIDERGAHYLRDRGEALYVVCSLDGRPHHIHFAGSSGD
jgi:hypothetical protein